MAPGWVPGIGRFRPATPNKMAKLQRKGQPVLKNDDPARLRLGWSDFARARYVPGGGHTSFAGTHEELLELVRAGWPERRPGQGRDGLDEVLVVPVDPTRFVGATVLVEEGTPLRAELVRRRPHEEPYLQVTADGPREEVRFAQVVLYSAAVLEQNDGARSGGFDWEVVALLASPVADEPMDPLTMARNMLAAPGGTPCTYTAEEFAAAIWYWAGRASVRE
jgi:hypothetical protein